MASTVLFKPNSNSSRPFEILAMAASLLTVLIALSSPIVRAWGIPGDPDFFHPLGAGSFLLIGAALLIFNLTNFYQPSNSTQKWLKLVSSICAALVILRALAVLLTWGAGWDSGLNGLLFGSQMRPEAGVDLQIALVTALSFFIAGLALLLFETSIGDGIRPAQILVIVQGLITLAALIGHTHNLLYTGQIDPDRAIMTPLATINFTCVFISLLFARPGLGFTAFMFRDGLAGFNARRTLLAAFVTPILLDALTLTGLKMGFYSENIRSAIDTTLTTIALIVFSLLSTRDLDRRETNRAQDNFAFIEKIINSSPIGLFACREDGPCVMANPAVAVISGAPLEVMLALNFRQIESWKSNGLLEKVETALATGADQHAQTHITTTHGRDIWINYRITTFTSGKVKHFLMLVEDITDQKMAENALAESEEHFRLLVNSVEDYAIVMLDLEGRVMSWNTGAERMKGYKENEIIGQPFSRFFPNEAIWTGRPQKLLDIARLEGRVEDEGLRVRKDGSYFIADSIISPLFAANGSLRGYAKIIRDITKRKQTEQKIEDLLELNENIIKSSPFGVITYSSNWVCISANAAAAKILDTTQIDLLAQEFNDFLPWKNTSLPALAVDTLKRYASNSVILNITTPGGRSAWLDCRLMAFTSNSQLHLLLLFDDVTEKKTIEAELNRYNARLERSNQDLQDFAYVASHDLQEPLRKIQAFGDRLNTKYAAALDETGQDYLRRMTEASKRMQNLINSLLQFSRVGSTEAARQPVDLALAARDSLTNLEERIKRTGGRVEIGDLPVVQGDPVLLQQLFQNLIGNGLKFHHPDRPPIVRVSGGISTDACEVRIEDNGIGFDMHHLERIFKPFQRLHTRMEYEGTGMGLAICRRIVERHSGTIIAEAAPGGGAIFIFTLPLPKNKENKTWSS